jgi:hypothetical protein
MGSGVLKWYSMGYYGIVSIFNGKYKIKLKKYLVVTLLAKT